MITHENFSKFVLAVQRYLAKSHPHVGMPLAQAREEVAASLSLPKDEPLRKRELQRRPVPVDHALCERIATHFASLGVGLPQHAWEWPLPEAFSLTVTERLAIWKEAIQHARRTPSPEGTWLGSLAAVEPYIKPAGDGRWFLCNRSPVPLNVCIAAFGPARVIERRGDNSIANDVLTRHEMDLVFHKALAANWKKEYATALALFREGVDAGHPDAALHVAWMLEEGKGAPKDDEEAVRYYRLAAERGVAMAHHNLGGLFLHGSAGLPRDIKQAIAHFEISAKEGVVESLGCLASIYLEGNGVPADREKADDLLTQGLLAGDDHSANVLATLIDKDNGGVSTARTVALYRRAARGARQWKHVLPFFNLGLCYLHGNGVTRNLRTARRLFQIAAKAGDADAALNLGLLHLRGAGTPVDLGKALQWIVQAASAESPEAVNLLGSIHLTGKHIAPDYKKAVELFLSAEALGSVDAVVNLAQCWAHGLGVEVNVRRAYMLLDQAESRGSLVATRLRAQWHAEGLGDAPRQH